MRRFGSLPRVKLKPRNLRSCGRATALLVSFTLSWSRRRRKPVTLALSNWLVNRGKVDPKTVQEMLRHAKMQTTLDLYTQGDNDNKISAQDTFCGLIVDQEAA